MNRARIRIRRKWCKNSVALSKTLEQFIRFFSYQNAVRMSNTNENYLTSMFHRFHKSTFKVHEELISTVKILEYNLFWEQTTCEPKENEFSGYTKIATDKY